MGSLMAGWDSPRSRKTFERSSSFTRDEINHYWKDNQPASDEEKAKQMSELASSGNPQIMATVGGAQVQTWDSFHGVSEVKHEVSNTNRNDWWKKTNYAYLNDRRDEPLNTKGNNSKSLAPNQAGKIAPVALNYSISVPSSSTLSPSPSPPVY